MSKSISGKTNFLPSSKRTGSPLEYGIEKRNRTSNERRRSLDSISSISSSSLDRSPVGRGIESKKKFPIDRDDDVIYIRSESRSLSPSNRNHM